MTPIPPPWLKAALPAEAYDALTARLPASRLWSLLLAVAEARAVARRPAELVAQWDRDRFVQPGGVDQRASVDVDRLLLEAASAFESIELSPVAPLGVCSVMGHASQNKVLSTVRGTEVVSDPTNVMALECARRLRGDPAMVVRLATCHRCVRAQALPEGRGFAANFRIFCLASAAMERENRRFLVDAVAEHMTIMLQALDRLEQHGFAFPDRRVTLLSTEENRALVDRIVAMLERPGVELALLEHPYYTNGLRFQISARASDGVEMPLIDGGAFDWVARLTSNHKAVYVASGLGSQLVALMFRRVAGPL